VNFKEHSTGSAQRQANAVGGKALAQRGKFDAGAWRAGGPRAENLPARAGSATATMP
jgi:hypothetical protein